jgi:ribonuclease E
VREVEPQPLGGDVRPALLDVFAELAGTRAAAAPESDGPVEELELTAVPADVFEADGAEPTDDEPTPDSDAPRD